MKKLAVLVLIALAGLVVFNYVTTGEIKLVPTLSQSEEERAVSDLQRDFAAASKQYAQAYRAAAVGGIDTTADADAAIAHVKRLAQELGALRKRLTEERAQHRADELAAAIRKFQDSLK